MGKRMKSFDKIQKRGNKGFTIIELITAIGIMAVLSVAVFGFMTSSSKTYSKLSVEAQLQSEAQLVANMITELAVDSFNAYNAVTDPDGTLTGYDTRSGHILCLETTIDGEKKQYLVARNTGEKALYLAERSFNTGSSTWGAFSKLSLLGNNVEDFLVDGSRVESENMLRFELQYKKSGKSYNGNYQVLMRNRAYADKEEEKEEEKVPPSILIRLDPEVVYLDIVDEKVDQYYVDTVEPGNRRTVTSGGVPFTATVVATGAETDGSVDWDLRNEDQQIFSMSVPNGEVSNLVWDNTKKFFKNSPTDAFTLVITKSITHEEKKVDANPKTAQILLRRVKSLNLYALSGVTQWKDQYAEQFGGVTSSEAQGYAYTGSDGKYLKVNLNAAITASNIPYGGGLNWKIQMKDTAGNWSDCTDASFAKLQTDSTPTGTANSVTLGAAAKNGQLYKVIATSIFDPSFTAEYIFGIAPSTAMDGDGFYSRGYYTNMSSFFQNYTGEGGGCVPVSSIIFIEVTKVDGAGNVGTGADKVKVIKDEQGNYRLYLDFEAFSYTSGQKNSYYGGSLLIHMVYAYYGTDGKVYINGEGAGNYKNKVASLTGVNVNDITCYSEDYDYVPKPVVVSKISPVHEKNLIVIDKGKSKNVYVKTSYYNILAPRNGNYFFGTYLDDMLDNLLVPGKSNVNAYFAVEMTSAYGDTNKYVDTASIMLTAKSLAAQKRYLTDPMTLRLTANDYYMISSTSHEGNSYTDYNVLLTNVEGAGIYVPGPKSTFSGLSWPSAADSGTETEVTGYNTNGDKVTAKVYKLNKKYYCKYNGKTYTYNTTYNFWAK